jgi:hypothetical protein
VHLASVGANNGEQVETRREVPEVALFKRHELADLDLGALRNHLDGDSGFFSRGFEFGPDSHAERLAGSLPSPVRIPARDFSESLSVPTLLRTKMTSHGKF